MAHRFAILILLFSSVVTLVATISQLAIEYRHDVDDIRSQLGQIRSSYSESLASSLWIASIKDIDLQLQGILRLPDLKNVEVLNEQGQVVSKGGNPDLTNVVRHEFPLTYMHRQRPIQIGIVRVTATLEGAYQRLKDKVIVILISQTIKTFLVSLFILVLFQWLVGRHLARIAAYSDRLFAGQMDQPLELDRKASGSTAGDELDQAVAALNAMRQRLHISFSELQESESRWKFALEGAGDGVWDFDVVSNEVLFSHRWKEMLGFSDDELPNNFDTYARLAHPQDLVKAKRALEQNFEGRNQLYAVEQRMRCKDGSWKWVLARGMVVTRDADGRATRMIGTHTDITERRAAEQAMSVLLADTEQARAALREANATMEEQVLERTAQLELANKELESFSYSVSHDLRSPLRGIDGWSLALQEEYGEQLDATARQYLDRVRNETQRMGQLIDGMLEFSRLGRAALAHQPVDMSTLAQGVAARVADAHRERQIEFAIAPGLHAAGDPRLLEAVLDNLFENSAKFSAGRVPARIEFGRQHARDPRTHANVSAWFVRDNGAGFDMQYAHKLFGVFQRLHKTSEFAGTGIGLATAQRIVQRHGGHIWASAAIDNGATFFFTLREVA
ncbi:MAG: PAS domain-containing protein [Pseudomonadota bacterium]|nr:PAS domain-containing protein [Pseudomonadota bacterium]